MSLPDFHPVVQLDTLEAIRCPCGWARRAFAGEHGRVASVHLVEIDAEAQVHHHCHTTEIYVVLAGEGEIELDGRRYPVRPLSAIYIQPGVRHRAIGRLQVINIPVPSFDPADEFVDPPAGAGFSGVGG